MSASTLGWGHQLDQVLGVRDKWLCQDCAARNLATALLRVLSGTDSVHGEGSCPQLIWAFPYLVYMGPGQDTGSMLTTVPRSWAEPSFALGRSRSIVAQSKGPVASPRMSLGPGGASELPDWLHQDTEGSGVAAHSGPRAGPSCPASMTPSSHSESRCSRWWGSESSATHVCQGRQSFRAGLWAWTHWAGQIHMARGGHWAADSHVWLSCGFLCPNS